MNKVLILDFGSQYTQLIARRIREQKVYCEIHPCTLPVEKIRDFNPNALILSGGPASVLAKKSPKGDPHLFDLKIPVLGICYGLQLIIHQMGGAIIPAKRREYGRAQLWIRDGSNPPSPPFDKPVRQLCGGGGAGGISEEAGGIAGSVLFEGVKNGTIVWMSHGDSIEKIPAGFHITGVTDNKIVGAISNPEKKIHALQFHPEVAHTQEGTRILKNFLFEICGLKPDWNMHSFIQRSVEEIMDNIKKEKVILGLSGGVDSSVAAVLIHRAIGDQLTCIFINNGLLRKSEAEKVRSLFTKYYPIRLKYVDASGLFLKALKGVIDPEKKRKIIGRLFIKVFEKEAKKTKGAAWLAQGTLYPDVIESVSFKGPSAVIKSHHNVGGLPKKMGLKLLEPFRELFKDEVRRLGRDLGMPDEIINRHPFPGPGLAIRVIGAVTRQRLDLLRSADAVVMEEIKRAGFYEYLWQAFAVLLPVQSVGVMGDERTYESVCALRVVKSQDGMTADWADLPHELLGRIASRIINEVKGINRVVYDITSKPPGTIEWE
ncbi:MAG: glutamine-hydrolyzing GMP synthase [Deltaproteobacteria bacterium]|nr:glutamine-hydrolyzing GMP synthase [Deltaproteobacteria bacterium]